jgi:hypothetical protein
LIDYDYRCGNIAGVIIYTVVDTNVRSFEVLHDDTERSKTLFNTPKVPIGTTTA